METSTWQESRTGRDFNGTYQNTYPFELRPLPYGVADLVPFFDAQTIATHHGRHQKAYVDNLNNALKDKPDMHTLTLEELILNPQGNDEEFIKTVHNNAGGVFNHELYFDTFGKTDNHRPTGALSDAINEEFGSFDELKKAMRKSADKVFGSGWTYLVIDKDNNLSIVNTQNQDTPLEMGLNPVLPLDLWEHAYYLMHKNRRDRYIDNYFMAIDWDKVDKRYRKLAGK